jgi:hypothetical protein
VSTEASENRVELSVAVSPELLRVVDAYLETHPELDRSKIVDEALALWCAQEQERAIEAQFLAPLSESERAEYEDWRHIRRAAAERLLDP